MAELSPEQEIGIAIVGCGQIVTHHCKALSAVKNVRVEALCDPSNERRQVIRTLCQEYDILSSTLTEYNTLDDLLSDTNANTKKIDAVQVIFIAVPHDLHVSITCQALDANKHVVLEKPLAPTIESCRELQTASRKSQGLLIVAEQSPYWQEIVKAKALLEEGKIGRLVSAASYYYESMRDNVTSGLDADGGLGWRCSLKRCGGGIVIDGGLHWMRPLRELCGDITSVVGVTQNCEAGLGLEGETLAHAIFKIKHKYEYEYEYEHDDANDNNNNNNKNKHKDLLATFSANMMHTAPMCHDAAPYFRLTGTKGELVIAGTGLNPNGGGGLRLYDNEHPNGYDLFPKDRQGGFFLGFQGLWNTVVKILRENDNEAAQKTVRDAAADVALALAIYKSSETGNWETCELFDN